MTTKRGRPAGAKSRTLAQVLQVDSVAAYRRLGGRKFLLDWAEKNPADFLKLLSRQAELSKIEQQPPPPASGVLTDEKQAAMRIAFVMAKALHDAGEPLTVEGEIVEPAPAWMPPVDQQPTVEQPQQGTEAVEQSSLRAPEPAPEDKPERRSLADLLGFEPPPAAESLYGGGVGQYRSGDPAEQGTPRGDLIGDVRVVQRRETVVEKLRRQTGG